MKPSLHLALALFVLALAVWPALSTSAVPANDAFLPNEALVKLAPGYALSSRAQVMAQAFVSADRLAAFENRLQRLGIYRAESLGAGSQSYRLVFRGNITTLNLIERLSADPAVVFAEPNYRRHLLRVPNDPAVEQQWALRNIQALEAWDIATGSGVAIAVLDTGVDGDHPDLSGQVLPGYNAIAQNDNVADNNGHGTAIAGLIAANTDNGEGIAGICWGCAILPVKVLNERGSGNDASVSRGVRWAADNGARVINMSLGGSEDSQILREAIEYALARSVLVVASSGNERQQGNAPNYPAAYDEVLAVGATGNTDVVTGFSNTGDYVDLTAPGVGLWTTLLDGRYGTPNGTSFSSPYVAGAAGLVWTVRSDLGWPDVACVLSASADDKGEPGKDPEYGWGRLNALKALQLAQGYTSCPLTQPAPISEPSPEPSPVPSPEPTPTPAPPSDNAPAAFAPAPPVASNADQIYFPETQHLLRGEFKRYWEANGGLPIFGYPISEEFAERGDDGLDYTAQYFERYRFELHPENPWPYQVQLSRIGDAILKIQGRDWFTFPKTGSQPGCMFFAETGQSVCGAFLSYWRASGLEFDGRSGKSIAESLALYGLPLSGPQVEEVAPGVFLTVQWFERARLEDHGSTGVLLGLLSDELAHSRGWR